MKNNLPNKFIRRTPRAELAKARVADAVAVQMSLRRFWNPFVLFRTFKFLFANRKRQRSLARLDKLRMGFEWRDSRPKKLQRELGLLPQIKT